jgi:hypothetical protein
MNIEYKKFFTKRSFGVELEVNATITQSQIRDLIRSKTDRAVVVTDQWANTATNDYWHVKYDRTCGVLGKQHDHGWEVASYIASGHKDLLRIVQVTDALGAGGAKVNENCGLHIHVDLSDFSTSDAGRLLAHWLKIEHMMCHILPVHRATNKYCRLLTRVKKASYSKSITYSADALWAHLRPTNIGYHENSQKKVSLNFVNYVRCLNNYTNDGRKTVELRMPEGTLSGLDVKNWVRLFLLFVENSKIMPMPQFLTPVKSVGEFLTFFGLNGTESFFVLSRALWETKIWVLNRLMVFGNQPYTIEARKMLKTLI